MKLNALDWVVIGAVVVVLICLAAGALRREPEIT